MQINRRILKSLIATARATREARAESDKEIRDVRRLIRDVNSALDPHYFADGQRHPRHPNDETARQELEIEKVRLSGRLEELTADNVLLRDSAEHAARLARNAKEFATANGIRIEGGE